MFSFGLFLQAVVGAIVWAFANVVYFDLKRKGVRNFGRFAAFWVGNPLTWVTFFVVPEGHQPSFEAPPDDDDALLAVIRHDRELRERVGPRDGGDGALGASSES